jgi:hypothetical protein
MAILLAEMAASANTLRINKKYWHKWLLEQSFFFHKISADQRSKVLFYKAKGLVSAPIVLQCGPCTPLKGELGRMCNILGGLIRS